MGKVGIGVIGCGVIAQHHLRGARQSDCVDVVAVADSIEDRARQTAEAFGIDSVYTSADDLLSDERVSGVVLAFPTRGRTEVALRALANGKHVLLEKPVAMNAREVQRMIDARGDRVVACCSSRFAFLPSTRSARDFVASGALGEIRVVHCRALASVGPPPETAPPAWRLNRALNGGGILVNWGCYDLDYLLGITGWQLRPRLVLARTWPVARGFELRVAPGSDAETHFAALILCEGGSAINFERGEYVAAPSEDAWHIVGSDGSLRCHMTTVPDKQIVHEKPASEGGVTRHVVWEGTEDQDAVHAGPIQDFAHAILNGIEPQTGLANSLVIQKITDAVYASAELGEAVEID